MSSVLDQSGSCVSGTSVSISRSFEHAGLWWPEWGERPASAQERAGVLTAIADAAPRLIPLVAHRYLPEAPHQAGNPVFSVMQADVVCYGADLADYFEREFNPAPFAGKPVRNDVRSIPFWSELVARNPLFR